MGAIPLKHLSRCWQQIQVSSAQRPADPHLQMEYEPQTAMEKVGAMVGMASPRVEKDLELFREFIERRGTETGTLAWRN
jgi:hypothetical protein